jgi:drug/metabolite transporter (DMT)-like permease
MASSAYGPGVSVGVPQERRRLLLVAAMATVILLWGASFSGMRYGLASFEPGAFALLRYLVASAALLLLAAWKRPALPTRQELPRLLLVACCGISAYNLLLCYGLAHVHAGPGAFINNSIPVFSALLAVVLLKERPSALMWLGILASMGGVAVIAVGESGSHGWSPAALLLLGSASCYAGYNVLQKPLLDRHGACWVVCWAVWLGTAMLLPWSVRLHGDLLRVPASAILDAVVLGLLPTVVAFLLWSWSLRQAPVSLLAPTLYLVPVVALAISCLALGERPGQAALIGCVVVMAGVSLVGIARPAASG